VRILRDTDTTIRRPWLQEGTPATGQTITVAVTDLDGNSVASGSAAEDGATGYYEFTILSTVATDVALWTIVWTNGDDSVSDEIEVVGNWLFTEPDARAYDGSAMNDATDFPDDDILAERDRLTDLLETWTGRSWVPRFQRFVLRGTGGHQLWLADNVEQRGGSDGAGAHHDIVQVLAAWQGGVSVSPANIVVEAKHAVLHRTDAVWAKPSAVTDPFNITVDVEYGKRDITEGVDWAALALLRDRLVPSDIPDRAVSWTDEFGNINLDTMPTVARDWLEAHDSKVGIA
jgi:hypothetical protein